MIAEIVLLLLRNPGSDSFGSGSISTVSANATAVSLLATDSTDGVGPYTYQWFLIENGSDIPGAGTQVGDDDLTLDQTGLTASTQYWWRIRYTDSVNNVIWSDLYQQNTTDALVVGLSYFWLNYSTVYAN